MKNYLRCSIIASGVITPPKGIEQAVAINLNLKKRLLHGDRYACSCHRKDGIKSSAQARCNDAHQQLLN